MKILFVCTGNTCRSPMAEGFLNYYKNRDGLNLLVDSAGIFTETGLPIGKNSIDAMAQIGIDISAYRSKKIDQELLSQQDLVLTMGESHKMFLKENFSFNIEKLYSLKEYVYQIEDDVVDPYGGDLTTYIDTRDEIRALVEKIVEKL